MSDKLPLPAHPHNQNMERKTVGEKASTKKSFDKARGQTRVNIGPAFQRWRQLKELKGLRSDAMVALFLLDSYEKQTWTPWKPGLLRAPPPAGSAAAAESLSDLDDEMSEAPEEMFELFENRIAEYKEELHLLREENERKQKLLDAALHPDARLHTAGVQPLMVRDKEVPPEQQEGESFSVNQENQTEPAQSKEDQEEHWSQEGEQLQEPEAADIIKFTYFPVDVKTEEDDEEKPQSSQLQQTQTDQTREEYSQTEAKGEKCEGSDSDFNPDIHLQPVTEDESSNSSETDDSGDWKAGKEGLNTAQNKDVPVSDVNCNAGSVIPCEFATSSGQEEHLQQHIGIHTGEKPFGCAVCGKRYPSKKNLNQHMRRHSDEKPFSCSVCQRRFNWKTELVTHMRLHTGEKPFSCSVCGQGFRDRGCLKRHFFVHTGEKPFSCSVCGKSFTQSGDLQRHSVVHTGEKLFSCLICGYKCTHGGDLNRHSVVHTGEKPFSCSVCGRRFTQSGALKRHSILHTAEQPFTCSFCDRTFTELESFKNHRCESQMA